MIAVVLLGLATGGAALQAGWVEGEGFRAFAAGILLAATSSLAGLAVLRKGIALASHVFVALLMSVFVGRVALVALFAVALYVLAPASLAIGLLSLVAFHFVFAVIEVLLLARHGFRGLSPGRRT